MKKFTVSTDRPYDILIGSNILRKLAHISTPACLPAACV